MRLREGLSIRTLVETGSHIGNTITWAADLFDRLVSIDISDYYQIDAHNRCVDKPHVEFWLGDSRAVLPDVVKTLNGPTMFWLDAHNINHQYGPGPDDCPLLEELTAINASNYGHAILIDDAWFFMGIEEFDRSVWPSMEMIRKRAGEGGYKISVSQGCVVVVKPSARSLLVNTGWEW